jgi:peptidoglycan/xylan/chitin deacetylase (PgdA/CDA1 family)
LPEDALVITFDDGYESVYHEAWPRLRARGFTATVFLISDYCGRDNRWPGQPASVPQAPLMTWEQATALAAGGCELGAHTRSHPALPALPPHQAEEEILTSQQIIQARTGRAARVFAYPYGAVDAAVVERVRPHFDGAVGTRLGLVRPGSDPYRLARVDAFYLTPGWIPRMRGFLFQRYLDVRQAMRSLRRRLRPDWRPAPARDAAHA